MRENSRLFLLMIKVNITNDEVDPLIGLLQVYILLQTSISNTHHIDNIYFEICYLPFIRTRTHTKDN